MVNLEFIRGLQILIVALISYAVTISFAGWFESLIAKKMGDDTPEQMGFLTLNPLEHFNVFGFAAVVWGIFFAHLLPFKLIPGWGRYIPLIPDMIRGKNYKIKILIEYMSRSVAHFILLIISITSMMLLCGPSHVHGLVPMVTANITSFNEVLLFLLYFIINQNIVLFIIHFVVGIFKYLIYFYMPRMQEITWSTMVLSFIGLVIGLSLFSSLLEGLVFWVVGVIRSFLMVLIS